MSAYGSKGVATLLLSLCCALTCRNGALAFGTVSRVKPRPLSPRRRLKRQRSLRRHDWRLLSSSAAAGKTAFEVDGDGSIRLNVQGLRKTPFVVLYDDDDGGDLVRDIWIDEHNGVREYNGYDEVSDSVLGETGVTSSDAASSRTGETPETVRFREATYDLTQAALIGCVAGFAVSLFKLSIERVRTLCYRPAILQAYPLLLAGVPAFGGLAVGALRQLGTLPPGIRGTVQEVDEYSRGSVRDLSSRVRDQMASLRKSAAAVFTLGTGCSLGPEGPCVELGMSVARSCMDNNRRSRRAQSRPYWNRILLSSGAAAGVAAGFSAPLAGVFFALEIMQNTFSSLSDAEPEGNADRSAGQDERSQKSIFSATANIAPVLLASVLSALVSRAILGEHYVLRLAEYSLKSPLVELPLYLLLGFVSGCVAFLFSKAANLSQSFFAGGVGSDRLRSRMRSIPDATKPFLGGLLCGLVGLVFPQTLFVGYGTLNSLLANNSLPAVLLMTLLLVKMVMTAIAAGSGLVGGTFAPSLFLGAMTGATFHNSISSILNVAEGFGRTSLLAGVTFQLADVPAYAMIGAASVLAALFRAPLTASLLLFELTRDYDVILPLMASAGVGTLFSDVLDEKFKLQKEKMAKRRDEDSVSWGDLASNEVSEKGATG